MQPLSALGPGLVVNNSRFLILPERQRYPNLASRVLVWPKFPPCGGRRSARVIAF